MSVIPEENGLSFGYVQQPDFYPEGFTPCLVKIDKAVADGLKQLLPDAEFVECEMRGEYNGSWWFATGYKTDEKTDWLYVKLPEWAAIRCVKAVP